MLADNSIDRSSSADAPAGVSRRNVPSGDGVPAPVKLKLKKLLKPTSAGDSAEMPQSPEMPELSVTDSDLLVQLASGSQAALVALLERYERSIYNLLLRLSGDSATAFDLTQETFLRIHSKSQHFRPEGNAKGWVFAIAINLARDEMRRKGRVVYLEPDSVHFSRSESQREPGPVDTAIAAETRHSVRKILGLLAPAQRELIVLRDFEGLTYEEISGLLGCEVGTVKSRLHRARRHFYNLFQRAQKPRSTQSGTRRDRST